MKLIEANPRRPEKGTNKLRPIKELIKGGIADGMSDELFDSVELEKGIKVELEHTDDEMIAKEIAKDHLAEDPEYYKKLSKIHRNPDNIKELSNTLGRNLQDGMSKIGGKADQEVVGNMVNILKTAKNPHSTVGEFYTNLYMVSYTKKVKKENYEANMVFDNRDNTFEVNVIKLPNYVATTKSFSTDDLGKFNLEAKKYFTDFEVDRFHKEVQKYLNDEVIKGLKGKNPRKKNPNNKDEAPVKKRPARLVKTSSGSIRAVIGWFNLKNGWEYFVLDSEQEGKDTILFCYVMGFENEFGYVSFNEVKPYLLGMAKKSKDLLDLMPPEDWEWVDNEIKEVDIYKYNR